MAILVDGANWQWRGQRWAHLVSDDSLAELHAFADRLGLERRWFQGDHYDVPDHVRARALAMGARPVSSEQLVRRLRAAGLRQRSRVGRLPGEPVVAQGPPSDPQEASDPMGASDPTGASDPLEASDPSEAMEGRD